jgi:hypothetical protein
MSIDTKQIIHIASEVVIIGGITAFFVNKTNNLSEQIEELSCKLQQQNDVIQQQNEIIQNHDNLILKLLNTVNMLVQENEKSKGQQQCLVEPQKIQPKIIQPKIIQPKIVQPKIVQPKIVQPKIEKNVKKNNPLNNNLNNPLNIPLPQTINSSKQVLIMLPPSPQIKKSEIRVEEIIDDDENTSNIPDNTSAILDEELEEELRELDNEELEHELESDDED